MKKIIKIVSIWWKSEKEAFRKWRQWRMAEKKIISKGVRKEFNDYADKMSEVFDIDREATDCELAKEIFSFVSSLNVSVSEITIYCYPDTMLNMTELLRWLGQKGYRQISDSIEAPDSSYRKWDLGKIKVAAWFKSDSPAACKYVEIGKKEVPIMKMVCPGDPDYPKDDVIEKTA